MTLKKLQNQKINQPITLSNLTHVNPYINCQPSFNQENSKTSLHSDEFENNSQSVKTDKFLDSNQSNKTLNSKNSMNLPQSNYSSNESQLFDPSNQIDLSNYSKSKRIKRRTQSQTSEQCDYQEQANPDYQQNDYYNYIPSRTNQTPYNLRQQPKKDYRVFIPESKIS